ncbi:MAG: ABC transporter permease [Eubacterium sp.]|nr:ABC transporter permease [Eubacterium sp.]
MDLKRAIHLLPSVAIYTLIFLLGSLVIIKSGEALFFQPNQNAKVTVGLHMPLEDEDNAFGLKLVEEMESFRETLDIHEYDSIEAGMADLNDKKIIAFIVIPADFVSSLNKDEHQPVRILFQENNTLDEHIVNDLLLNSADLLGTAEAVSYTIRKVSSDLGVEPEKADALEKSLSSSNFTYVIARDQLFALEQFDELAELSLNMQLAACFTLLVLSLLSFLLTPFYQGRKPTYIMRQHSAGLGRFGIRFSEWISTVFLLYASYLIIFAGLFIAGFRANFISLVLIIPVLMLLALFIHLLAYSVKSSVYANLVILVGIVLLMYISGGLIPMTLLPKFLQNLSHVNPVYGMIRLMQRIMFL